MPPTPEIKILILDVGSDKGNQWADDLASVLTLHHDLRALVILPSSDPSLQSRARKAGAEAVLVRPFAIRDFIQAVDSVGAEPLPS